MEDLYHILFLKIKIFVFGFFQYFRHELENYRVIFMGFNLNLLFEIAFVFEPSIQACSLLSN
jgi:hypothetical protein